MSILDPSDLGRRYSIYKKVRHYRKKIAKVSRQLDGMNVPGLDREEKREIESFWKGYSLRTLPDWHRFYAWSSGKFEIGSIPEDVYYPYLEMSGSHGHLVKAYVDKNNYARIFPADRLPFPIIRCENGIFCDPDHETMTRESAVRSLSETGSEIVLKPSLRSGGGSGILIGSVEGRKVRTQFGEMDLDRVLTMMGRDFLVERSIVQDDALSRLYPGSVNTIKAMSARCGGAVEVLSSFLRIGRGKNRMDNVRQGGIAVGIDRRGRLRKNGITDKRERPTSHPGTGIVFEGYSLPGYEEAADLVRSLHDKLRYFKFASWDIALEKERGPVMIEVNLYGQEINFHQCLNGPLFGHDPGRVLDECLSRTGA